MHSSVSNNSHKEFAFSARDFEFISAVAYEKTGIVLTEQKKDMVYGRLTKRLRALKINTFSEYCDLLRSEGGTAEMDNLINAITTNLTSFFREGHHFEHLAANIAKESKNHKIRIWSSACSSGMEPYSIAMTLNEALPNLASYDVKILATDIDSNMVATAAKGEYADAEFEKFPSQYKKFINHTPATKRIHVADELKSLIAFKQLNLLEHWPMKGPFDAIFCRNVMIYFDKPTKVKLINRMADLLPMNGLLYIGHSENLHGISDRFTLLGKTIYRRIK